MSAEHPATTVLRAEAIEEVVQAMDDALQAPDRCAWWEKDPYVTGSWCLVINFEQAAIVYTAGPYPDFELASWFERAAEAGAPYPWRRETITTA